MHRFYQISLNFYGLVSLLVRGPRSAIDFLRTEWGEFERVPGQEEPDIIVNWKDGSRGNGGDRSDGLEKRGVGWYKGCFWRAAVTDGHPTRRIEYASIPPSNFLFKDSCIEPVVLAGLESKGLGSLHASGLLIGQQAWIFCGGPRSGKTILALLGARFGHILLSDDIVILGKGYVHPYPVPPRVYLLNYRDRELFDELISRIVSPDFVRNALLSVATLGRLRVPTRLRSPTTISTPLPVNNKVPLGGFFLLRPDGLKPVVRTSLDAASLSHEISRNLPVHGGSVLDQLGIRGKSAFDRTSALENQIETLLDSKPGFEICTTRKMTMSDWTSVFGAVLEIAGSNR